MTKKILLTIGAVIILILASVWFFKTASQPQKYTGAVEDLRLGVSKNAPQLSSLIYIAENQGFFTDNKLHIIFTVDANSTVSRKNVAEGAADLGTTSDFGFVSDNSTLKNLRILSVISNTKLIEIIGRRDKGITSPQDLKGKKIALTPKSYGEFFLGSFLSFNGLKLSDVTIIPTDLDKAQDAIVGGTADVVVTNDPFAYQIKQVLGQNMIDLPSQPERNNNLLLVSSTEAIQAKTGAIQRFLAALLQAEKFIEKNPEESKRIIGEQFKLDTNLLDETWPKNTFRLSLEQALIVEMEDETRWSVENTLIKEDQVPNYLNFIYFDALEKVKPEAVTIIH